MSKSSQTLPRRHVLRAAGLQLALPPMMSLVGTPSEAAPAPRGGVASESMPKRFIGICETLGLHAENLFPKTGGSNYETTRYLERLKRHRKDFTLFSGLSHTGVSGGHSAEKSFLSGAPDPQAPSFRNTVSLDQVVAEAYGDQTRLASLYMRTAADGGKPMSVDRGGQSKPVLEDLRTIFATMFLTDNASNQKRVLEDLRNHRSVIDGVLTDVDSLRPQINSADQHRLDEYLAALREVEQRMSRSETWERTPRPSVDYTLPKTLPHPAYIDEVSGIMLDLSALAFRTDSTRSIALKMSGGGGRPLIKGVTQGHHGLSHHGQDDDKIAELALIEEALLDQFSAFLDKLGSAKDADGTRLLDNTVVLFGSNLGNASSHSTKNLPIFVAGGGLNHGQYVVFDPENHPPLTNLYLRLLHQMGIPAEHFASSTGTIDFS